MIQQNFVVAAFCLLPCSLSCFATNRIDVKETEEGLS